MTQMGAEVLFDNGKCSITKDGRTINIGHIVDNKLYTLNTEEYAYIATAKPCLENELFDWYSESRMQSVRSGKNAQRKQVDLWNSYIVIFVDP